ncbi:MAG: hypothetical protein ACOYLQ_11215 [Hyphomicrobiaceae bacterium]
MEIALVVAVMAALGFAIWLRAYAGGRLAGMREATAELMDGIVPAFDDVGRELPAEVRTALAKLERATGSAATTSDQAEQYRDHLRPLGKALANACLAKGAAAREAKTAEGPKSR